MKANKICPDCNIDITGSHGNRIFCKSCRKKRDDAYRDRHYIKNRDKFLLYKKKQNYKNREKNSEHYYNNKDKIKEKCRKYYIKIREKLAKRYAKNKEHITDEYIKRLLTDYPLGITTEMINNDFIEIKRKQVILERLIENSQEGESK